MRFLFLAAILLAPLTAAPRPWKNSEGDRSINGTFVKRDATSITILRSSDRREIAIPLDKLHPDDRTWVNANHPLPGTEAPPPSAVFDQLSFGDTRAQVLEKLKTSKFVEMTTAETFIGRTGLNGVFKPRKPIGGLDTSLYFDWTEQGTLSEIFLQTELLPKSNLESALKPCWQELIPLLTNLYGKPAQANDKLDIESLADHSMSGTHLWKLDGQGSAVLGTAREGDSYRIVVRFTRQNIEPVKIP